ncbi:hypothetical protein G6514_007796 [Epicoccum nigrum]|nr:hypothetical protein G6514_007796 [Epicoccum nigrum]
MLRRRDQAAVEEVADGRDIAKAIGGKGTQNVRHIQYICGQSPIEEITDGRGNRAENVWYDGPGVKIGDIRGQAPKVAGIGRKD